MIPQPQPGNTLDEQPPLELVVNQIDYDSEIPIHNTNEFMGRVILSKLRELAGETSLRGPRSRNTENIVSVDNTWQEVADNLSNPELSSTNAENIRLMTNMVVDRINKLHSRAPDSDIWDLEFNLASEIIRTAEAVGITEDSSRTEVEAAVLITYFHGSSWAESYMSGDSLIDSYRNIESGDLAQEIYDFMTRSRLIHFARYFAQDPIEGINTFMRTANELASDIPETIQRLYPDKNPEEVQEIANVFTTGYLLKIIRSFPSIDSAEESIRRVVSVYEVIRDETHIGVDAGRKLANQARDSKKTIQEHLDRLKQIHEKHPKPGNMTEEDWWAVLVKSRGDESALDQLTREALLYQAGTEDFYKNGNKTDKKELFFNRISELRKQGVNLDRYSSTLEYGNDFAETLLNIAEHSPETGLEILEIITNFRESAVQFSSLFPEEIQESVTQALDQRLTELLMLVDESIARGGSLDTKVIGREVHIENLESLISSLEMLDEAMINASLIAKDTTAVRLPESTDYFEMYGYYPENPALPSMLIYIRPAPGSESDHRYEHTTSGKGKGASIDMLIGTKPGVRLNPLIKEHEKQGALSIRIDRDGFEPGIPRAEQTKDLSLENGQATLDVGSILGPEGTTGRKIGLLVASGNTIRSSRLRRYVQLNHNHEPFDHALYGTIDGFSRLADSFKRHLQLRP